MPAQVMNIHPRKSQKAQEDAPSSRKNSKNIEQKLSKE
jgi:hypothetical protein